MKSFGETKKGKDIQKNREEKGLTSAPAGKSSKGKSGAAGNEDSDTEGNDDEAAPDKVSAARAKLMGKAKAGAGKKKEEPPASSPEEKPRKGKQGRFWDGDGKYNEKIARELDFSKNKPGEEGDEDERFERERQTFLGDSGDEEEWKKGDDDVESLSSSSDEEDPKKAEKPGRVGGLFKTL